MEATHLAEAFMSAVRHPKTPHDVDSWFLAALAWTESGFRPDAVEGDGGVLGRGRGPGFGLFQHHGAYSSKPCALDPDCAAKEEVLKAARWVSWHIGHCEGKLKPHDWVAHRFAGNYAESNERAITSAAKVRERRATLWESVYTVD